MELLENILSNDNYENAYKQVYRNKGTSGVDGITIDELKSYLKEHKEEIWSRISNRKYKLQPVKRVNIAKENEKLRKLGILSEITNEIFLIDNDLKMGYQLKELFLDIVYHLEINDVERQLDDFIELCNESDIE